MVFRSRGDDLPLLPTSSVSFFQRIRAALPARTSMTDISGYICAARRSEPSMSARMKEAERIKKTEKFINKYLVPGKPGKGMTCYGMMADAKGTKQNIVAFKIKEMEYGEFMNTIYWHLIAWQVKHNAGWRCEKTGKKGSLVVHHVQYYGVHGWEMFHLRDGKLICVSEECHRRLHHLDAAS